MHFFETEKCVIVYHWCCFLPENVLQMLKIKQNSTILELFCYNIEIWNVLHELNIPLCKINIFSYWIHSVPRIVALVSALIVRLYVQFHGPCWCSHRPQSYAKAAFVRSYLEKVDNTRTIKINIEKMASNWATRNSKVVSGELNFDILVMLVPPAGLG